MIDQKIAEDKTKTCQEHNDMSPRVSMDIIDDRVCSLTRFFIRDASESKDFHIEESSTDTDGIDMELHEGLLIHICEQVPVFFSKRSSS